LTLQRGNAKEFMVALDALQGDAALLDAFFQYP
jgi:hypothetical protein